MSNNVSPQLRAGGNILPNTFVKVSTAADNTALQAGANEAVIGISGEGIEDPPGVSGATTYHATSGHNCKVYGLGDICLLKAGSGGFTHGDLLKSDATGGGVTIATSGVMQHFGAKALESAASGEYGRVQIIIGTALVTDASGSITTTDITGTDSSLGITGQSEATSSSAGGAVAIAGGIGGSASGNGGVASMAGGAGTAGGATGGLASVAGGAGQGAGLGGAATVTGGLGGSTNAVGGAATVTAGAGNGTGNGAVASMVGGASGGGATGTGGVSKIVGGAAASVNGSGGAAQATGGVAVGTGTGGAVTITGGASGGASGTAGAVTIDTGAATGGTGAAISIGPTNATGVSIGASITMANATNLILNTSTGTKIGTATTQKLSFFNATPVVQPAANTDATTGAAGSTNTIYLNTTFTGASGTAAFSIGGVVTALKALGLLAP